MSHLKNIFSKVLQGVKQYKFAIACATLFLSISLLLGMPHLNQCVVQVASALSFFFLLHLLIKTKYIQALTIVFSIASQIREAIECRKYIYHSDAKSYLYKDADEHFMH